MSVREVLIGALALIEKGWCQGSPAKNEAGDEVWFNDPTATQFCLIAAISKTVGTNQDLRRYLLPLEKFLPKNKWPWSWNDEPGRTKEEVVDLFRKAIDE